MSFTIISIDLRIPGNITGPTGVTHLLNCMRDMTTFVVSIAMKHVNVAELAHAFITKVLLKLKLCVVVVVNDDPKFKHIFIV